MAVYLYRPPTWRNPVQFENSALVVGITTSTCVYRVNGVWFNQADAGIDDPDISGVDVDPEFGFRLFFNKPTVVPDTYHDELAALQPADPSWTPGELILL